ncbi:MAG TPA: helix-turn-helix domain-containing protein [Burkholderiaceae bacterium]
MTAQAEETSRDGAGERPLRRDAERNRQRILAAAAEVFTERGLDATLDEVARAAGVGVGTVYRRFPDKESLIAELFRDRIDALVTVAEEACAAQDPWQGLVGYLEFAAATLAGDLGLRQLMMFGTYERDQVCYARDRMQPVITKLVERAQAAGELRADFRATDVKMIGFMLSSVAEYAASAAPEVWRRYLGMLVDGLRPSRPRSSALPVPAPTAEELAAMMSARAQRSAPRRERYRG